MDGKERGMLSLKQENDYYKMENDFFGKEFLLYIKQSEEKYNILGIEYVKYAI